MSDIINLKTSNSQIGELPIVDFIPKRKSYVIRRVIACLIDYTIFLIILCALAMFVLPEVTLNSPSNFLNISVIAILWILVLVFPEAKFGYTIGKGVVNLRVAKLRESDSMFKVALKRHVLDFIEFPMWFGLISFIMIINSDRHQRIGDMFAHSIVVRDE
jgi:uncharacterized RDD family membrane protein YckC